MQKILQSIEQLIGQGEIEDALEQLVAVLDSDPKFAELAQATRLNQADFFQTKASVLKGTISGEDARLAQNQVTDNVLQIIRLAKSGKTSLAETIASDPNAEPSAGFRWGFVLVGVLIALTGVALFFWYKKPKDPCPDFGQKAVFKTMLLRLVQTGDQKTAARPETDIMAELNKLFERNGQKAVAKVNGIWEGEYPTPEEAVKIAGDCGANMIVYGRAKDDFLDIEYRILDSGGVLAKGDSTFPQIKLPDGGNYSQTAENIAQFLLAVVANRSGKPLASLEWEKVQPPMGFAPDNQAVGQDSTVRNTSAASPAAASFRLEKANAYLLRKDYPKAFSEYQAVLEIDPTNWAARYNTGLMAYNRQQFADAARDLNAVADAQTVDSSTIKKRVIANLKSGQPAKAAKDLDVMRTRFPGEKKFIEQTSVAVQDTVKSMKDNLAKLEKSSTNKQLATKEKVAKISEGLGDHDKAIQVATEVTKKDPDNLNAIVTLVKANIEKGDTLAAKKVLKKAQDSGVSAREVARHIPVVKQLLVEKKPQ